LRGQSALRYTAEAALTDDQDEVVGHEVPRRIRAVTRLESAKMNESDAGANAGSDAVDMPGRKGPFGGLTPSEAARRRWSEAREQESDPLAKTRTALERKAASGDVQAARELREHADYYYGSATTGDAWKELLTAEELALITSTLEAARARALATPPGDAREGGPSEVGLRREAVTPGGPESKRATPSPHATRPALPWRPRQPRGTCTQPGN
jgi:hypothetical protein